MAKFKKEKTRVHERQRPIIKERFFNKESVDSLALEYWYNKHYLKKWLDWRATTIYIAKNWVRWRRCSICRFYRIEEENFSWHWWKYKAALCKYCDNRKKSNKKIILKNIWEEWRSIQISRETWYKNKWKYNTRRKILKIIWYMDVNWKIIKKDQN